MSENEKYFGHFFGLSLSVHRKSSGASNNDDDNEFVDGRLQNKCALYWPKKSDGKGKAYLTVPEGRVGVKLISETEDKNFIVSEFELTREDLQVSISCNSLLDKTLF